METKNIFYCACNCGEIVPINQKGRQLIFIHGHNLRCFSKASEIERCQSISKSNKIRCQDPIIKEQKSKTQATLWGRKEYKESQTKAINKPESKTNRSKNQKITNKKPEVKEKRSRATRENWKDENIREKRINKMKEVCNTPEVKEKRAKTTKSTWKDQDIREKRIQGLIKTFKNPEIKQKLSDADKQKWSDPVFKTKTSNAIKLAYNNPEVRKNASIIQQQIQNRPILKLAKSELMIRLWENPDYKDKTSKAIKAAQDCPKVKVKMSEATKRRWQDPIWKNNQLIAIHKGNIILPNKPESFLKMILNEYWPGRAKYTGDFSMIINGKCPDFIVRDINLIIEHYGDYWHKGEDPIDKAEIFAQAGYDTLIIWEHELENLDDLIWKIKQYMEYQAWHDGTESHVSLVKGVPFVICKQ